MTESRPFRVLWIVFLALAAMIPARTKVATAETGLVFETTFDCPTEWSQKQGLQDAHVCKDEDQILGWGAWTTGAGSEDQITPLANNPLGSGMGFRHWRGAGGPNNGGGIRLDLSSKTTEAWIRWYMRYQKGFAWQSQQQTKELYVNSGARDMSFTLGFHDGGETFGVTIVTPKSQNLFAAPGWNKTMGGRSADGLWHLYECHVRTVAPTLTECWIDEKPGRPYTKNPYDGQPVTFGDAPLRFILVGSNHLTAPPKQPDMYVDYDDFAISTTGYVGPIARTAEPQAR